MKVKLKDLWYQYVCKWHFWIDALSLLPLEVFYAIPVLRFNVLLRLPRLFKVRLKFYSYLLFMPF